MNMNMYINHYHVLPDNTCQLIEDKDVQRIIDYVDDPLYYRYMEILEELGLYEINVYFLGWGVVNDSLWHKYNDENAKRLFADDKGNIRLYFTYE